MDPHHAVELCRRIDRVFWALQYDGKPEDTANLCSKGRRFALELQRAFFLSTMSTRELLDALSRSRATGYSGPADGLEFSTEAYKSELATREHVMNKAESKEFRQKSAKTRSRRGFSRK